MKSVKLHIVSVTKNDEGESRLERWEQAKMAKKNGKYYAFYQESGEGMENVKTILKWDAETVVINRSGGVENRQEFRQGVTTASVYKTPYLQIPLGVKTNKLVTGLADGKHRLEIEYLLSHGDAPYGEMKILMELEEQDEH